MRALLVHLDSEVATVCRCWAVRRRDGRAFGFTDHDEDLAFEGVLFRADTGLTAEAMQQSTGLSVDNSEAFGALTDASVTEDDIRAGRFDGARVTAWLVNWAVPEERMLQFHGTIGEVRRVAGAFRAELRGLTEALNQPQGLVYQPNCSAVLGDRRCRFDLDRPGFAAEVPAEGVEHGKLLSFAGLRGFTDRWFEGGCVAVLSGAAEGLSGIVKNDRRRPDGRFLELWEALRQPLLAGDRLRIEAGCDKRPETCRGKFGNQANFRGFPHIPGEDWLMAHPARSGANDGGSLRG